MQAHPPLSLASSNEPASPCIRQCRVVYRRLVQGEPLTSLCASCGRTTDDIADWQRMSAEAKRTCIEAAAARLQSPVLKAGR